MRCVNIVGPKFEETHTWLGLFYTDEEIRTGEYDWPLERIQESDKTMAHLLARLGKFESVNQAKKNGWDKPIPTGWTEFHVGSAKNRWLFYIWNPEYTMEEFVAKFGDAD